MRNTGEEATNGAAADNAERHELLARIARLLGQSLDYESTLQEVAQLATSGIADWCAVDLLQEDGTLDRVAVAHPDPQMIALAYEIQKRYPSDPNAAAGVYQVLRTGEPELYPQITGEMLRASARDEEHLQMVRSLELRSMLLMPLIARERVLGALTLATAQSGRHLREEDMRIAGEIAQLAALAVDNARLYSQAQQTKQMLEQRVVERTAQLAAQVTALQQAEAALLRESGFVRLLQQVAVAANEASTMEEALRFALEAICEHSGWPVGHVFFPGKSDPELLRASNIWYVTPPHEYTTFRELTARIPFASGVGLPGRVFTTKQPAWISDVNADEDFVRARQGADIGVRAGFAFPVLVGQEVVAVLEFFAPDVVAPDEAFLDVVAHIGTQLGRVAERERAAQALQERSEQLAQAQRVARLGSWEWDARSGEIIWSEEMFRIFAADPRTFRPTFEQMLEHFHPDDRDDALQTLRDKAMGSGEPYELIYRIIRLDGAVCYIHSRSHPILDENGTFIRLVGTWQDITPLKQAEELNRALLALSHRLNATLDLDEVLETLIAEAIRLTGAEGGCTGLCVDGTFITETYYYRGQAFPLPKRWAPGEGIPGWVLAHKETYLTNDAPNDPQRTPDVIDRFGLRAVLAAPVVDSQGQVLAFFEVADKKGQNGFGEEDREKLDGLAQIAAIAIGNAQLYEQQRHLSQRIVAAQEEERQRLSRELHDSTGQLLTALSMQLSLLAGRPDAAGLQDELVEATELTHAIHDEIRVISQALRPPTLELFGLGETLRTLCTDFARRSGLAIDYHEHNTEKLPQLSDATTITFYRFLQEALSNVARHANASHVGVTLHYDQGLLSLSVADDGDGFATSNRLLAGREHGVGLLGLRERFELLEGELLVDSRPGAGTRLTGRCRVSPT
ncbi:MAG: GAF domain-containing protein [Anaerolineae bacterium]|nr:GAF domain-containing protein [Anaerolineae bacterium]